MQTTSSVRCPITDYEIKENGDIVNKKTGKTLKPQSNNKGYGRVFIDGKLQFVHRLVAQQHVPNPYNKAQVNHINGVKTDNRACNLEWVDNQENRDHAVAHGLISHGDDHANAKLDRAAVAYIRRNANVDRRILARQFNVAVSTIADVIYYRTWKPDEKVC